MKTFYYSLLPLWHNRRQQAVLLVSLSLGLLVALFLFARIAFELGYDTFWQQADRLCAVKVCWTENGVPVSEEQENIIAPIPGAIAEMFPHEVQGATVYYQHLPGTFRLEHGYAQLSALATDTAYLATMGLRMVQGDRRELLRPDALFLSVGKARELFGDAEPLGQRVGCRLDNGETTLLVRGLFEEVSPDKTTALKRPEALLSLSCLPALNQGWNGGGNFYGCVRLAPGADLEQLNDRLRTALQNSVPNAGRQPQVRLVPVRSLYLSRPSVRTMLWVMGVLGAVLLFTMSLNYVLVTVASLARRAKAVGVHKCNGAGAGDIFRLFLTETLLLVGAALLLTILLILRLHSPLEELAGVPLDRLFAWRHLWAPGGMLLLLLAVGAGVPGWMLARIPVTQVFRRYTGHGRRHWKRVLLFVQFGSAAFVAGMLLVVLVQYRYVTGRDRGYRPERVAYAFHESQNPGYLCSLLRGLPYVEQVATADNTLLGFTSPRRVPTGNGHQLAPRGTSFDRDFLPFIGLRLAAGRNVERPGELLANRSFVRRMNWTGDGLGHQVDGVGTVVGLLEDFSFAAAPQEDADTPVLITCTDSAARCIHLRLREPFRRHLTRLNEELDSLGMGHSLRFRSLEDAIAGQAASIHSFLWVVLIGSVSILFILFVGLTGYIGDEIRLRSKEIAIRKVNGAEARDILRLLSHDIWRLSLPAVLLGLVGAWWGGRLWISQFVETLHLPPSGYLLAAAGLLAFIGACVARKAWRIALENPVLSIKSE